jgi:sterol desaturase/sphingolipid hydroxylase (fatty acid hydroxylase superfamily)
MSDYPLALLRGAYFGTLIGGFVFFLAWESANPRVRFGNGNDHAERKRHRLRNFGMLLAVVLLADLAFGIGLLNTPSFLAAMPGGLLSEIELGWPVQLLLGVVAVDFVIYWLHRAMHAWPPLWRIHRVHHSDPHLDATTSARFHPVEVAIDIVLVLGTLRALGIPLWVDLARTVFVNPLLMAQHADVVWPSRWDALLRRLFATPEFHRVHHSPLRAEHDANYGQILSCWDRWFGTWRDPPASSAEVGLAGFGSERWQSIAGMLATPLRGVRHH